MAQPTAKKSRRPPSPRQVLLGWFILFQIAFLVTINLGGFVKWGVPEFANADREEQKDRRRRVVTRLAPEFLNESGPGWQWLDQLEGHLKRWAQLTYQDQDWSLFAPGVAKATGFPAVLLIWDEPTAQGPSIAGSMFALDAVNGWTLWADWSRPGVGQPSLPLAGHVGMLAASNPVELLSLHAGNESRAGNALPRVEFLRSDNEPDDIHDFFRVGKCRLRRYEGQLYINTQPNDGESPADLTARMTQRMRRLVTDDHDTAAQYLRWRLSAWKQRHPDEPLPRQVILLHRLYRIRGPHEPPRGWEGPVLVPMVRWQPDAQPNPNQYALEPFDFSDQRFYSVSR